MTGRRKKTRDRVVDKKGHPYASGLVSVVRQGGRLQVFSGDRKNWSIADR